jgi:hypothetical protein
MVRMVGGPNSSLRTQRSAVLLSMTNSFEDLSVGVRRVIRGYSLWLMFGFPQP